jgi:hypothetical protein
MSTGIDRSGYKIGRKPRVKTLASHLAMARFGALVKALPPPPPGPLGRAQFISAGLMWLNDRLGDCTAAAKANIVTLWAAANGVTLHIADGDVLAFYEGSCGYNPADPSTDQGGNMDAVGDYFIATGLAGHKARAKVIVDPRDHDHVKHAINRYGACDMGVSLPLTAQTQAVWDLDVSQGAKAEVGSWGGHDLVAIDYSATGPIYRTWAEDIQATWLWHDAYQDEGIAYLGDDWAPPGGTAPCGISSDELAAELELVAA